MTFRQRGLLGVLLWISVSILAVIAVEEQPQRWDLTQDQRHTLSDTTRELLTSIESPLEIKAYLPTHIPAPYSVVVDTIKDSLGDYAAACSQPVRITIKDPQDPALSAKERAALAQEAEGFGLRQAELDVVQRDRRIRQKVWFGIAILYQERQLVVPPIETPDQLEYSMARALREIIRGPSKRPIIGVTIGHGEPNIIQTPIRSTLEASGAIKTVLLDGNPIPNEIDALVILAPSRPMQERDRYVIDQFLLRGGGLVALLDYRSQSSVFPEVLVPTQTGLEELFSKYGVTIRTDLTLVDRGNLTPVPIKRDDAGRVVMGVHPLFARAEIEPHVINRGIRQLITPMASPIEFKSPINVNLTYSPLAKSVPNSVMRTDVRHSQPEHYQSPDASKETQSQATVAATLSGLLPSAFIGPVERVKSASPASSPKEYRPDRPFIARGQADARIVLATSGGRLLSSGKSGLMFLQNSLDWVVADTSLAAIRARQAEDPQITDLDESLRWSARIGTIIVPAFVLLAVALVMRRRRIDT